MASEVTTASGSAGETLNTEVLALEAEVVRAARAARVITPLVTNNIQLMGATSKVTQFPKMPAIATAAALSEGSDLSNTAVNTTGPTITAATKGVLIELTDLLVASSALTGAPAGADIGAIARSIQGSEFVRWAGDGVMNTIEADLAALFTALNGGTGIGTSGTNLTLANLITATYTLESNNAPGDRHLVIHPVQWQDLLTALTAATGTVYFGAQDLVRRGGLPDIRAPEEGLDVRAYKGRLFDFDIWVSSNCPTANSAADRSGAMFVKAALGIAWKWFLRVELQRNASKITTEAVATAAYGVAELTDTYGVPVETDA